MKPKNDSFLAPCLILAFLFGISNCAGNSQIKQPAVNLIPTKENNVPQIVHLAVAPQSHEGSLWRENGLLSDMFEDLKARKVGDILTIQIEESSKATNQANTQTGRASSLEAGIEKLFGLEDWYQSHVLDWYSDKWPKINPFGNPSVKGSMASRFDGSGTTTRSGDLSAFITARITEVLQNGNFKIVGSRELMVNNENQLIIVSGVIRPRDISPDNVILSTFISDAKIAYSGSGIIDDRQRPGWLANLLNTIWPF